MNKKGFTLIELLAVIVILAIIALIATPIVLNIIDDTKKEAELRSADFYLDGLELSIAQATLKGQNIQDNEYNIMENGNLCLENYDVDKNECNDEDQNPNNNELIVEVKGEVPKSGTISIKNGQIDELVLTLNNKVIGKNDNNELIYIHTLDEVCVIKDGTPKTAGAKYECKVDPNKEPYTFYVLTTATENDKYINLIMESNIRTGGEPVIEENPPAEKRGLVNWISNSDYGCNTTECASSDKGPITAMNYLEEATKNWTNTNKIKTSKFTRTDGEIYDMAKTYNTYARLPYYSEVSSFSSDTIWIRNFISPAYDASVEGRNVVTGVYGYWLLSYPDYQSAFGSFMSFGSIPGELVGEATMGVRPVITLKI